ncbi:hypothetical protein DH2020_007135 [Rehmannia glutinosa]|uniref:O-fucosyltransferase family protein n=1 Tax=Rehmannia glutinosa TaxID=99300 RepID=A0ABR0TY42_REHGL
MALTYTTDPTTTTTRCRRRLHLHSCKHRHQWVLCFFFTGIFHKRYLFVLSILYIVGLITCAGRLLTILHPPPPPLPGSLYRSHELFLKLWPEIQSDNTSNVELDNLWRYRRKLKEQRPCLNANAYQEPVSSGLQRYLVVEANGGLNQQRSPLRFSYSVLLHLQICNAVAVAGLLNATLVIPRFDLHNVWKDPRQFADIYDEDHFISSLKDFVTVVRDLPKELMESYNFSISNIPNFRIQAWASARYYLDEVYPILQETRIVRISPFANRLATSIPPHIQFLRCLANYKALRFSSTITNLAKTIVNRMIGKSLNSGGKYVSVHLRFEEVGMMLRGMGFSNDTPIYLASGKIYKEERFLEPLRTMFPLLQTKESLATPDELAAIQGFSSRLAALDYTVCLFSEVFVTTQGGNFPHFLMGHRRFLYNGHAKTIMPDKSKLVVLFQNTSISSLVYIVSWLAVGIHSRIEMESMLAESDRKSIMVPRVKKSTRKGSIYLNPLPECRFESESASLASCMRKVEWYLRNIADFQKLR